MNHDNNEFFYCYSTNLFHFLKANGQRFICTGLHATTKRQFWQFRKTNEVQSLLDEYDARKERALK